MKNVIIYVNNGQNLWGLSVIPQRSDFGLAFSPKYGCMAGSSPTPADEEALEDIVRYLSLNRRETKMSLPFECDWPQVLTVKQRSGS